MFWKKNVPGKSFIRSCNLNVNVEVRQKQIRNFYLRVYPEEGRVVLSAPVEAGTAEMEAFIREKTGWIQKNLLKRTGRQSIDTLRAAHGEIVPVWGEQMRILHTRSSSRMAKCNDGETLILGLRNGDGEAEANRLLSEYYREEMKNKIPEFISVYQDEMGVRVGEFGVKKMKTRWGSCNTKDRRIWLNLELALYAPSVLEFVVVHEMVHLLERLHSRRFYRLMDYFLPDWRIHEEILRKGGKYC